MDVLVTGAGGAIGGTILEYLGDDEAYSFRYLDTETLPDRNTVVADVTDYESIRPAFDGHDAVVYLVLVPGTGGAGSRELGWSDPIGATLRSINNVYEAAVDADLDTIVFVSPNHAVGIVEVRNASEIYYPDSDLSADETEPHRPDSAYGLTKSYGEDLGRLAAEAHDTRFYGLWIWCVPRPCV